MLYTWTIIHGSEGAPGMFTLLCCKHFRALNYTHSSSLSTYQAPAIRQGRMGDIAALPRDKHPSGIWMVMIRSCKLVNILSDAIAFAVPRICAPAPRSCNGPCGSAANPHNFTRSCAAYHFYLYMNASDTPCNLSSLGLYICS